MSDSIFTKIIKGDIPSYKIAEARCIGKENTRGWYAGKAAIDLVSEIKRVS